MSASLKVKRIVQEEVTLTGLDRMIPADKDVHRSLGRAAHYLLDRFEFDTKDPGQKILKEIIQDIKSATATRAPRNPDDSEGPQLKDSKSRKPKVKRKKKSSKKKATAKKQPAESVDDDPEAKAESVEQEAKAESSGEGSTPQAVAPGSSEESGSEEGTGAAVASEASGSGPVLRDPFGDSAGG
jgi:hypothetical protein